MSNPRYPEEPRARRRAASSRSRSGAPARVPLIGKLSMVAAAGVLGATGTVVLLNRDEPRGAAGPVLAAPVAADVTLQTSLWKSKKVKAQARVENTPLELGTRFTASRDGEVAGVRFYKPAGETGGHRGSLWDADRRLLAKVAFTGESRSGWQQAMFDRPVPITAGRTYTVSYHTSRGGYVAAPGGFDRPVTAGPLTAEAGVFNASGRTAFPSRVHRKRVNYFVDVIFRHRERRHGHRPTTGPASPIVTPTVTPTGDAAGTPSTGPTPSATGEVTATPSTPVTPSRSATPSRPATPSAPVTPSRSATPSRAPDRTPTATPSHSPRPSLTADPTKQPTREPTPTAKPTQSGPPPSTGDFPGPGDTGVPAGTSLKSSESITITKDGTVIDGMDVRGEINVAADNVTIRNTRVAAAPGEWGIIQRQGKSGLKVENSEIFGNGRQRTQFGIINQGGDLTVRRVDIHTISNGILTEQGLIEDSYLHDPKYYSGDHTDMIMCTSGPPSGAKLVIRGNTVINTLEQTGAIALFQDFGVVRNVTVEGNFLAGGGYSLYGGGGSKGTSANIKVVGNVFSKDVWPKGGYNGPVAYWDKNGSGNEWSGNVWEDGKPVPAGG
ncbi:hypothetical protein Sru01_57260 [Sphaerisporangium rufum]|uniref:DUF4082 domain-containing protein n=1 Tax=Sphaerisporangium rufum TaxID=1381558 RepID=A0A919V2H3_9ACTN|nr:DUF4082 domain-containing protein [Sphaerisporangium rufum]GII80744.1 hypothetical protein Sru01_57260 [Sphaerisporangium rufum]